MTTDPRQAYFSSLQRLQLAVRRMLALAEEHDAGLTLVNDRLEFPFEGYPPEVNPYDGAKTPEQKAILAEWKAQFHTLLDSWRDAVGELHCAQGAVEESAIQLANSLGLPERATVLRAALQPSAASEPERPPAAAPAARHRDEVRRAKARERQRRKRERDRVTKRDREPGHRDEERDSVTGDALHAGLGRAGAASGASPASELEPAGARRRELDGPRLDSTPPR